MAEVDPGGLGGLNPWGFFMLLASLTIPTDMPFRPWVNPLQEFVGLPRSVWALQNADLLDTPSSCPTEKAKGIGSGHAWQVALAAVFGLLLCLVPVVGCFLFFYWRHHGHLPLEGLSKLLWHRRRQKGQLEGYTHLLHLIVSLISYDYKEKSICTLGGHH